jgi:hypothetical protein
MAVLWWVVGGAWVTWLGLAGRSGRPRVRDVSVLEIGDDLLNDGMITVL